MQSSLIALFSIGLFLLSAISGMLGIGVGLVAVPVLSLGLADLVNQVHPLSLLLNGVTALFSMVAFARAGLIDWRRGFWLSTVATVSAPCGAFGARYLSETVVWVLYFAAVILVLHRMLIPSAGRPERQMDFRKVLLLAIPASVLSGLIGVGPGFLLVPIMVHYGIGMKQAAGLNAMAVTPSSFAAVVPHLGQMALSQWFVIPLLVCGALGAVIGAWLASHRISPAVLQRVFIVVVASTSGYRALTLLLY